jgi:hypothetical protein
VASPLGDGSTPTLLEVDHPPRAAVDTKPLDTSSPMAAATISSDAVIALVPGVQASLASAHATLSVQADASSSWLTFRPDGSATWQVRFLDPSGRIFGTFTIARDSEPTTVNVVAGGKGAQSFLLTVNRLDGTSAEDALTVISDEAEPAATNGAASTSALDPDLFTMLPDEFYENLLSSGWTHDAVPPWHGPSVPPDQTVPGESSGSATDLVIPSMPERIGGWSPIAPADVRTAEEGGEPTEAGESDAREATGDLGNGQGPANSLATVDLARGLIDAPGGIGAPPAIPPGLPSDSVPPDGGVADITAADAAGYRHAERMARGGAAEAENVPWTRVALALSATLVVPNLAVLTWSNRRRRSRRQIRDLECERSPIA